MRRSVVAVAGPAPEGPYALRTRHLDALLARTAWNAFHVVLLLFAWVQFSAAWLYPAFDFDKRLNGYVGEKPMGVPFQYTLWVLVIVAVMLRAVVPRRHLLLRTLAPFVPFGVAGVVAALIGYSPATSMRWVVLWSVAVLTGALIGQALDARTLLRTLALAMLVTIMASLALAVVAPEMGLERTGLETGMRGFFTGKNQFGWVSAVCLLFAVTLRRQLPRGLMVAITLCSLPALWLSQSKGALVAVCTAVGLLQFSRFMRRRATLALTLGTLLLVVTILAMLAPFVVQGTLDLLGKDTTLSGRTVIWGIYADAIGNSPWVGEGPGAFTSPSPFTLPLATRLWQFGAIMTPHNVYLATLGDAGLLGLIPLLCVLGWMAFVLPLKADTPLADMCAAMALLTLLHGTVETHDVFAPGLSWFFVSLTWAASRLETPGSRTASAISNV